MKRFEYKQIDDTSDLYTDYLNRLGEEGWELVGWFRYIWYFKRELPERHIGGPK